MTSAPSLGWTCFNCDQPLPPGRDLFCSEVCSEFAKNVRYHRRVLADGRIKLPDVEMAVAVRMAYAAWGQAPARPLASSVRAAVFAAKGDRCAHCGDLATNIDHIESAYFGDDSLANLQPLCRACHLEKTLASPMPWGTESADARAGAQRRAAEYERRVHAPSPLRPCDDEREWPTTWRSIRRERARELLDHDLKARLNTLLEQRREQGHALADAVLGEITKDVGTKRRHAIKRRLLELLAEVRIPRVLATPFHTNWPPDSAGIWPPRSTGFGHPLRRPPAAA